MQYFPFGFIREMVWISAFRLSLLAQPSGCTASVQAKA